jgi:hypothetical protein
MQRTKFTFEPTPDKYGRIRDLYVFTREGLGMKYYCDEYVANVYKAENILLDILDALPIKPIQRKRIEKAIEAYGGAKDEKAQHDAEENYWEREAGANL